MEQFNVAMSQEERCLTNSAWKNDDHKSVQRLTLHQGTGHPTLNSGMLDIMKSMLNLPRTTRISNKFFTMNMKIEQLLERIRIEYEDAIGECIEWWNCRRRDKVEMSSASIWTMPSTLSLHSVK